MPDHHVVLHNTHLCNIMDLRQSSMKPLCNCITIFLTVWFVDLKNVIPTCRVHQSCELFWSLYWQVWLIEYKCSLIFTWGRQLPRWNPLHDGDRAFMYLLLWSKYFKLLCSSLSGVTIEICRLRMIQQKKWSVMKGNLTYPCLYGK